MAKKQLLRRFSRKETEMGIHVPTHQYYKFIGLLSILDQFYFNQIMPNKPEYAYLRSIICSVTEIAGVHFEEVIFYLNINKKLIKKIKAGNTSFYDKYEWMLKEEIINNADFEVLEKLKNLRNILVHIDERTTSSELKYLKNYATGKGLLNIINSIDQIVQKIDSKYETGRGLQRLSIPGPFKK